MEPGAILPLPATVDPAAIFSAVAGDEPLVLAVRTLLDRIAASRVVVAVAEPLVALVHDVLATRGWSAVAVVAAPVPGDRYRALLSGLQYLAQERLSPESVLVHDYRHPLVPGEVTDRVIAGLAAGHRIVVPVIPVTDSVKSVDERGTVVETVDRTTLRTVQYPRGFAASSLAELLGSGPIDDEFDTAVAAGLPIAMVDGHADAVRFTLAADAELLDAIITSRRSN
ncbi:MAG: 2-C-methyl-D-erythritol 4-phosphate cytidylyltransferase [Mycobacterium sp.]|jgi:2-C-methyl-D-erythritol 4-phosphate cytidylyltransferase|nr:2-C-methyl-D-erythritol 4-phosphate cytidylyltransferase [Mycobacterium sp.]